MYLVPEGKEPLYVALKQNDLVPVNDKYIHLTDGDAFCELCKFGFWLEKNSEWRLVAWPPEEVGEDVPCFLYGQQNEPKLFDKMLRRENTFYAVPVWLSERELDFIHPVQFPDSRNRKEDVIEAVERQRRYWAKEGIKIPCAEN